MAGGAACDYARVREVPIDGGMIRLGQFLKLAGIADSGGDARAVIAAGEVGVNGEPETRRGRQLHPGDRVECGAVTVLVAARPG